MANIKGKLRSIDIAADGSLVKLRVLDGGKESTVALDLDDVLKLTDTLVGAIATAKIDRTMHADAVPRFIPMPSVLMAHEVNVNWMEDADAFVLEVRAADQRRHLSTLKAEHVRFLWDVYGRTRTQLKGPVRH